MRRTIFLALLAALLLAPAAARAGTDPIDIQRDCADDGVLQGNYTPAELRKARDELPTDADEYSDCRDVLSRAIAKTASKTPTPTPSPTSDGAGSGGDDGAGGATGSGDGSGGSSGSGGVTSQEEQDQAVLSAPSSPQDAQAVGAAAADGDKAIKAELAQRDPGNARLAASVGRNGLPTSIAVVLALIAVTLVAAFLPLIRRGRVFPGRPPE
jgi:opacity protein-like surface antigen